MFCPKCGNEMNGDKCPSCGYINEAAQQQQQPQQPQQPNVVVNNVVAPPAGPSPKDWLTTLLLCIFTGGLGIHRFFVGKTGTGVLYLLTAGLCGIGSLIDLIQIVCGNFTDGQGRVIKNNK